MHQSISVPTTNTVKLTRKHAGRRRTTKYLGPFETLQKAKLYLLI